MMVSMARGLVFVLLSLAAVAQAEEVTLSRNGLTLNAELMMAEGKGMEAPTVLLTHGTLAHNRMEIMTAFQQLLVEAGFNTLAINLSLGIDNRHGMYDCATPHRHTHTEAMDEMGAWVGWLKQKGAKQITLLGHSRGGNQTAWYAAEHDDPVVAKVVLVAPMTWQKGYETKEYNKRYHKPLAPLLAKANQLVAKGKGDELMKGIDFIYCEKSSATARAFANYYNDEPRFDTPSLLTKIRAPVLVIAGSEDTTVAEVPAKVAPLANEHIKLLTIDGADHFFRDLYSEEAVEAMVSFIRD